MSTGAAETTVGGRLIDVLTGAAVSHAVVASGAAQTTSDAVGRFELTVPGLENPLRVTVQVPGFVERQTLVDRPDQSLSLIPTGFDLAAFNTMMRPARLYRWTAPPPVVVLATPLRFTSINDTVFTATEDTMAAGEFESLVGDLEWALPQMTGGTFSSFGSVTRTTAADGTPVSPLGSGVITVVTMKGLYDATYYWGYGRALVRADGAVIGGVVILDSDVNGSNNRYKRSLRAHELGHALGYCHLSGTPSVMHPSAKTEPTAFDREASRIAYSRPPGNIAPDNDAGTGVMHATGARWTEATP